MRHPGYVGTTLFEPAAPVMLGSWWPLAEEMAGVWGVSVEEAYERLRTEDPIGTLQAVPSIAFPRQKPAEGFREYMMAQLVGAR